MFTPLSVSQKVLHTELGMARASWGGVTGRPLRIPCHLLASVTHQELFRPAFLPGGVFHSHMSLPDADHPIDSRHHASWSVRGHHLLLEARSVSSEGPPGRNCAWEHCPKYPSPQTRSVLLKIFGYFLLV